MFQFCCANEEQLNSQVGSSCLRGHSSCLRGHSIVFTRALYHVYEGAFSCLRRRFFVFTWALCPETPCATRVNGRYKVSLSILEVSRSRARSPVPCKCQPIARPKSKKVATKYIFHNFIHTSSKYANAFGASG